VSGFHKRATSCLAEDFHVIGPLTGSPHAAADLLPLVPTTRISGLCNTFGEAGLIRVPQVQRATDNAETDG
jgi:hypothetical protein